MAERLVGFNYFEGLAIADKPTGVTPGSHYKETDTNKTWITFDGDNWVSTDERVRLVTEAGVYIDLVTGLTAMEALKTYEFSINGVNFNGHSGIKTLMLEGLADSTHFRTLQHYNVAGAKVDYVVPDDHVFIAYQALIIMATTAAIGRIGESDDIGVGGSTPGEITKDVLFFGNGTLLPFMTACYGVFAEKKYITASAVNSSDIEQYSVLFGVERDA